MKKSPLIERHTTVRNTASLQLKNIRLKLLDGKDCEANFTGMGAPIPPQFDTRLMVVRHAGEVMICAWLSLKRIFKADVTHCYSGSVEVLFDRRNDGFGFTQFVFEEGGTPLVNDFSPYPESKSTQDRPLKVKRWGFDHPPQVNQTHFALAQPVFYAVFDEKEIFRWSEVVGFNFCRSDLGSQNISAWSFLAGNGAPDATSLGKLHRDAPKSLRLRTAPAIPPAKNFRISVTNDSPMMVANRHYTLASLDAEMAGLKRWGVDRLDWVDYSNYPAFWSLAMWRKQHEKTVRACGDLLTAACQAARKHRIELTPVFKIFDLSFLAWGEIKRQRDALPNLGGAPALAIPEVIGHEEAFMQTNSAWRKSPSFPIQTLRLYSMEPLSAIDAKKIRLFQSVDNIDYQRVRIQPDKVTVKKVRRPNRQWSPAGIAPQPGTHDAWMIELRGLSISEPFVHLSIEGSSEALVNRQFAMVEAIGKDGTEAPFLCADTTAQHGEEHKFEFFGRWPGWNNYNDHSVEWRRMNLQSLGLAFFEPPSLPGMLEPTHPAAQKIWLDRVDAYLEHDIAGLSIRTLCHHRRCPSWLQYAFAPSVISAFRERHGRDPAAVEADYEKVRLLRGEALGDFLAAASAKIRRKGKKSLFQVETGGELPADRESRMAIAYDYEKWISSGLFDELHVRSISGHSPWLRQVILPLARKHGVEVHLLTRNHASGFDHLSFLEVQRIVSDAKAMGYGGVNFYESANLYELTDADTFFPRAMAEICVREAVRLAKIRS